MPPTVESRATVDAIILGCVATKHPGPARAKDLYASPMFAKRRRYADMSGKPWVIVSAHHGILDPDDVIDWYDVRQSDEIVAKYSPNSLAVKILEDDLPGWARHAILRSRSKKSR